MRIELLYFEGCPSSTEVLGSLENVVVQEGFPAEILPVIPDPDGWSDFPGRLKILVNGEDLVTAERHLLGRATGCSI